MDYMIVVMKGDYKNIVHTYDLDYAQKFVDEESNHYDYVGPIVETNDTTEAVGVSLADVFQQRFTSDEELKDVLHSFIQLLYSTE